MKRHVLTAAMLVFAGITALAQTGFVPLRVGQYAEDLKRTSARLPAAEFPVPQGLRVENLCSVSYLRPVDDCPVYHEYFKEGDVVPAASCPIHKGSLKQEAARAIGGFFSSLGKGLAGLFRKQ